MKKETLNKYIGLTKGCLTIIELDHETYDELKQIKRTYFKCKCKRCGKITIVRADRLSRNSTYLPVSCSHCVIDRQKEIAEKKYKIKDTDFIIGSVHNINSVKLRLTMPSKTKSKIYEDYFNEILAMVKIADIDVIGHLDLMKRYAFADYGNYEFEDYKDIIEEILTIAIKRNIGLEINTSGLRNKVNEVYPKIEILNLYKMLGGTIITIGSDSHSTDDCFSYCKQGYDLLKACGFEKIYTFTKRCPIEHKI